MGTRLKMTRAAILRTAAAGPGALLAAFLVMAALPLGLPGGRAGIDNLVVPMVAFPAIWALLFFYACLDRRASRALAVVLAAGAMAGVPVAMRLWT